MRRLIPGLLIALLWPTLFGGWVVAPLGFGAVVDRLADCTAVNLASDAARLTRQIAITLGWQNLCYALPLLVVTALARSRPQAVPAGAIGDIWKLSGVWALADAAMALGEPYRCSLDPGIYRSLWSLTGYLWLISWPVAAWLYILVFRLARQLSLPPEEPDVEGSGDSG